MSEPDELAKADQKVTELKKRIARQLEVVDRAREGGLSTAASESILYPAWRRLVSPSYGMGLAPEPAASDLQLLPGLLL